MNRAEIILGVLAVLGTFFYIVNYPLGAVTIIISLLMLSCLYFCFSFALFNKIQFADIFKKDSFAKISASKVIIAIGTGIALSIILIGILFKILRWPFSNQNLLIGGIMISIISIFSLVKFLKNRKGLYREVLFRYILYGSICGILLLQPDSIFLELKYSSHPDYIEALKKLDADPDNVILQMEEQKEYDKMKRR